MAKTRKTDQRWILPAVVDPPRKCFQINIPDDENHQKAFFAALHELAQAWVWEWDDTRPAEGSNVAAVWDEIIFQATWDFFVGGGCMNCNYCYVDVQANIDLFVTNIAIVNTWVDAFVTSGGVSVGSQVSNDIKIGQGHDTETKQQYCLMVDLFIDAFVAGCLQTEISKQQSGINRTGEILAAVAGAFAAAAILLPPALAGAAAAAGLGAAIGALLSRLPLDFFETAGLLDALNDAEAVREMKCCMYSLAASTASINSWAGWSVHLFRDTGTYNCTDLSANGEILRQFFKGTITPSKEMYVSFYRQLDDFGWLDHASDLPLCGLCGDWCYAWDFTASNGGFTEDIPDRVGYGDYVASEGWHTEYPGVDGSSQALYIRRDLPTAAIVKRIEYWGVGTGTGTHPIRSVNVYLYRNNSLVQTYTDPGWLYDADGEANNDWLEFEPVEADEVWVIIVGNDSSDTLDFLLTALQLQGNGANPMGADNC